MATPRSIEWPPVRTWQVDPLIYAYTFSHLSGLNFALGASYGFEPTFFGHAAGALLVLVMGANQETNRACKYYKLTSDNDGEAFRWTSNYQIISKVYLKKHSTLPLCYSLSAADKKMVTSTMKKMVGSEAE